MSGTPLSSDLPIYSGIFFTPALPGYYQDLVKESGLWNLPVLREKVDD